MVCTDAFDNSACKLKLVDDNDSCYGTVLVPCNDVLQFFFDENGNYEYAIVSGGGAGTDDGNGGPALVATTSSTSSGKAVSDGTTSGLRGASGPNRFL
jgi:hypothetical protein